VALHRPRRPDPDAAPRTAAPGTVTRLVAQQHEPERVSVYLDGAFAFGVHRDLVLEHGLRKGQALTAAEITRLFADDDRLRARAQALAYPSTRARTRREVATRLHDGGIPEDVADEVLDWLAARGLLDDAAYAGQYAESRRLGQGYGPERVRQELRRRGVDAETARAAVEERYDEDETLAMARAQAERRWPGLAREPDPRKRRKKLFDFLVRRGFSFDTARRAVEAVSGEDVGENEAGA
jgi:regulatory protein